MLKRLGTAGAACALIATVMAAPVAAADASVPCRSAAMRHLRGDAREVIRARTFHIVVEPQAETYEVGSKAKLDITVTRPAHEDPADLGVEQEPPASAPAENVIVGIGAHVGDVFLPGFGVTGADGKVTIGVKLARYVRPGTASLTAYAWNVVHESPCLRVEEDGYANYPEAFEVAR
jgi:hypothetical protein